MLLSRKAELEPPIILNQIDGTKLKLTSQKYMGKQAAQYEPEDPHYVMSTDSRGKKKRMVVSHFTREATASTL